MVDPSPSISFAALLVTLARTREDQTSLKRVLERYLDTFCITMAGPNSPAVFVFGRPSKFCPASLNESQKSSNFPLNSWRHCASCALTGLSGYQFKTCTYSWIHKSAILTELATASNETDKGFYHSLPGEIIQEGELRSAPFLALHNSSLHLNSRRVWPNPMACVLQSLFQILWDQNQGKYELLSFEIQEETESEYFARWETHAACSSAEDIATPTTICTSLKEKGAGPQVQKNFWDEGSLVEESLLQQT